MPDPRPGTTLGRIAALEQQVADLAERLDAVTAALPPPARDPASTTAASTALAARPQPVRRTRTGFGPITATTEGDAHA